MDLPTSRITRVAHVEYEIRAWKEREWVLVRAFRDDEPVGLLYGVGQTERRDFEVQHGHDAVLQLMDLAESDLSKH